jgi:hypothetical protein
VPTTTVAVRGKGVIPVVVTVTPTGGAPQSCASPCSLAVPPGVAQVEAAQSGRRFRETLVLSGPTTLRVQVRDSLSGAIGVTVTGAVLMSIGLGLFAANGFTLQNGDPDCFGSSCTSTVALVGVSMMAGGGIVLVSGAISFAFVGHNKIDAIPGLPDALASGKVRVGAVPVRGGGEGALTFQF